MIFVEVKIILDTFQYCLDSMVTAVMLRYLIMFILSYYSVSSFLFGCALYPGHTRVSYIYIPRTSISDTTTPYIRQGSVIFGYPTAIPRKLNTWHLIARDLIYRVSYIPRAGISNTSASYHQVTITSVTCSNYLSLSLTAALQGGLGCALVYTSTQV